MKLTENNIYRVKHRSFDNLRTITAKRRFLFKEDRFGSIPCYCFTSRLARGVFNASLISIPEYDLLEVKTI